MRRHQASNQKVKPQDILLVGNSITAEIFYAYLRNDPRYRIVGTAVNREFMSASRVPQVPGIALEDLARRVDPANTHVLLAAGYRNLNRVREQLFEAVRGMGFTVATYLHPEANYYAEQAPGEGTVILARAMVEPGARIGKNTVIWANAVVAHHASVGDHCWIASGAVLSGETGIGARSFVGVNATVVNRVRVGELNFVGAGALITRCTKPNTVHLARSAETLRYAADEYERHFGL